MKLFLILFSVILVYGCQNKVNEHPAIGTWKYCSNSGKYFETKITDKYMFILRSDNEELWFYDLEIKDSLLIITEPVFKDKLYKEKYDFQEDTLFSVNYSKNRLTLASSRWLEIFDLKPSNIEYSEMDTLNIMQWKSKILNNFKQRTKHENCPDLRTEEEKAIIYVNDSLPEDNIQIIRTDTVD